MALRKTLVLIFIVLFTVPVNNIFGQATLTATAQKKKNIAEALYKLLDNYSATAGLKLYTKSTATKDAADKYVALFVPGARVVDEINPINIGQASNIPQIKSIEQYEQDVLAHFSAGLQTYIAKADINFSKYESDTVTILIEKVVSGQTLGSSGFGTNLYQSHTQQLLYVVFSEVDNKPYIVKSELVSGKIACVDCSKPGDDLPPKEKTPFQFNISVSGDGQLVSSMMNTPDYSKLNYLNLQASKTVADGFHNRLGYGGGAALSFDFMFTENRNIGLGVNINYSHQNTSFGMDSLHLEYEGSENHGGTGTFLRYNDNSNIKENFGTDNAGISLLFKYQTPMDKGEHKVGFYIQFGPEYYFMNTTRSSYSTSNDQLGIYNWQNGGWKFNISNPGLTSNSWVITRQAVTSNSRAQSMSQDAYFNQLNSLGYNVSINNSVVNKTPVSKFNLAMGGSLSAGAIFHLADRVQLLAGVNGGLIYYSGNSLLNTQLNDTGYNSLLYAMNKLLKIDYGITLGLKIRVASNF